MNQSMDPVTCFSAFRAGMLMGMHGMLFPFAKIRDFRTEARRILEGSKVLAAL